jgi:hypothetical protein
MGIFINIQSWWKSSTGRVLLAGDDGYRRHLIENLTRRDSRLRKAGQSLKVAS